MQTLLEVLDLTARFFAGKNLENARLNAELIFAHVLDCKRMDLYVQFERPMPDALLRRLRPLVRRRSQREPLQYVLGEVDFVDLTLQIDDRALIPRPETEELVEKITAALASPPPGAILDLGTGCGCIALTLARRYPRAAVVAVDRDVATLSLARENAVRCGLKGRVEFRASDWFAGVSGRFDLIVSNPPYLSSKEWENTAPEVHGFEPRDALVADGGGLGDLEAIITDAPGHLAEGGLLALETGSWQHPVLTDHLHRCGFSRVISLPDVRGRDRFLLLSVGDSAPG